MASAERFGIFTCSTVSGSAVTTDINQIQNFAINPGASRTRVFVGGAVDPKAHILANASPFIRFGTRDIATYFGVVSATTGLALTGTATFRLQERSTLAGVFETGTTHETYTVAQGIVIPVSMSAQQDDVEGGILESELICEYNGSVNPIVKNTGVDFSSGITAPAFNSTFYLGPVYVNGSEVKGIISSSVQFGITYQVKRTSGAVFASKGAIVQRAPMISITTLKVDATSSLDLFLRALSGTVAVYYWKGVDAGSRVAVGTSSHLKLSAAAGSWGEDDISVRDNEDGTATISIMPTGTLSMSIASTIP